MISINITGADAVVTQTETLTAGRVGLECTFSFDSAWDGLSKIAVCEGADTRSVVMDSDTIIVPWECLADPGYKLRVGVRGENSSGDIVIPTVWARVGKISDSPGDDIDPGQEATPSVVQQIQETAANALYIARGVRADADSGAFDGETGPCPSVVITQLPGGYRITIYDDDGPHSFEITSGGAYLAEDGTIVFTQPAADGNGIPNGGNPGQVLRKRTSSDYDVLWEDSNGIPDGGTTGQVLKKKSGTDYDVEWGADTSAVTSVNGQTGDVLLTIPAAVTVDSALSDSSENPVQNKVIKSALDAKGTYSKPSGGIPATDLASAVQTSLGKADTALQSFTETDPTVPSWAKASTKPTYTASEVGAIVAPSSPATGAFLVWDGLAWTAQTLSAWQGGSY